MEEVRKMMENALLFTDNQDFSQTNGNEAEMKEDKKINIYLHVVDTLQLNTKVVSMLYIIHKDRDFVDNNTCGCVYEENHHPALIKPVLEFNYMEKFYPSGMSCVYLDSRLYFMGGSISYITTLLDLDIYNEDLVDKYPPLDAVVQSFEDTLECFPPHVYVFDCVTGKLLPPDDDYSIPPMNSGKPPNPVTFVVGGEIFVLSSKRGPHDMCHFETINPRGRKQWEKLPLTPQHDFLYSRSNSYVDGSCVMDRKLFLIFSSGYNYHLLCYDIDSREWNSRISSSNYLNIYRDSVFIGDTIYTAASQPLCFVYEKYEYPLLSFTPVSPANILDEKWGIHNQLPNRVCHDRRKWPIYQYTSGSVCSRHLLHLGRHLNVSKDNSRILMFVELSKSSGRGPCGCGQETVSEFNFIVFEPLELNSDRHIFDTKTLSACRLSTDIYNYCELNAAGIYTS